MSLPIETDNRCRFPPEERPPVRLLTTRNEPLAVEHGGHDPPSKGVGEQQHGPEAEREPEGYVDHIERDERCHRDHGKTPENAELLCDADVARSRGDRDADPDRQAGEKGREKELGEDVRSSEDRRRDRGMCEEHCAGEEDCITA